MGRWRKLYRALAVALTVACIVTGSSFSVLAAEPTAYAVTENVNAGVADQSSQMEASGKADAGDNTASGEGGAGNGSAASSGDETGNNGTASGDDQDAGNGGSVSDGTTTGGDVSDENDTGNSGAVPGDETGTNEDNAMPDADDSTDEQDDTADEASGTDEENAMSGGQTEDDTADPAEEDQDAVKEDAVVKVVFRTTDRTFVADEEIKISLAEGETHEITQEEITAVLPDGYVLKEADLTGAVAEAGKELEIAAVVELQEAVLTASATLIFRDEEGNVLEDMETEITVELEEGAEYVFTEEDIRKAIPEGYAFVRADLTGAIVTCGDQIEIAVTVKAEEGKKYVRLGDLSSVEYAAIIGAMLRRARAMDVTRPEGAIVFFDAADELPSFNVAYYWDSYSQTLSNSYNSGLKLKSSTDGMLVEGDILRINWESGAPLQYTSAHSSTFDEGYTDGNYTMVGWGGSFENGNKKTGLRFKIKPVVAEGEDEIEVLTDALNHLRIRLTNEDSSHIITITSYAWSTSAEKDEEGYYLLEAINAAGIVDNNGGDAISGDDLQGIKFAFDRRPAADEENKYHRGTLLIKDVELKVNDVWTDFSPFNYEEEKIYPFEGENGGKPLLREDDVSGKREVTYNEKTKNGEVSGHNIATNDADWWHLWNMSTSDANIVDGEVNDLAGADALQIKYNNKNGHTTYARLEGTADKSGEWLVMTLKGADFDPGIKIDLNNGLSIPVTDFKTSMDSDAANVTVEELAGGYQTVYYHFTDEQIASEQNAFHTLSFDFSNVTDQDRDVSRMFVKEIYLLDPTVEITKSVNLSSAHPGDTLIYTLQVTNPGPLTVTSGKIEDKIPDGLEFVDVQGEGSYDEDSRTVSWDIHDLETGSVLNLTFRVKIPNDVSAATYYNSAQVTEINGRTPEPEKWSNRVATIVTREVNKNPVFYAEVGQKTDLLIGLGQTSQRIVTTTYQITVPYVGDGNASSASVSADIPAGATVTLTGPNGGFIMPSVVIGDKTFTLTKGDASFTANGEVWYNSGSSNGANVVGPLSNFQGNSITLNGVEGGNTVTINCSGLWDSDKTFTLTVSYQEQGEPAAPSEPVDTTPKEYSITTNYPGDNAAASGTVTGVDIPAGATVTLTGPNNGGFIMADSAVVIGNVTYDLDTNKKDYLASGDPVYFSGNDSNKGGNLSSFNNSTITLLNAPSIENGEVQINLSGIWDYAKTFTLTVTPSAGGESSDDYTFINDTFASIPASTQKASIENVENADTLNSATLKYTSSQTGVDTFDVTYYPGGDKTKTPETITVTVYNYQVSDKLYVLDYGLPVNLTAVNGSNTNGLTAEQNGTVLKLDNDGTTYAVRGVASAKRNTNSVADADDYETAYGESEIQKDGGKVTFAEGSVIYTPTSFMDSEDEFYYGIQVTTNDTAPYDSTTGTPVMEGKVTVMPASVVYYEDNFTDISYSGETSTTGTNADQTQSNGREEQYGHDEAYAADIQDSTGVITKMTSEKDANGRYSTRAEFTFNGTGFDIVGRSSSSSTILTYSITNTATQKVLKYGMVDTFYANGDLYQIPVIHEDLTQYANYTGANAGYQVELVVCQSNIKDEAGQCVFYLDGIRIYNPLGEDGNENYADDEKGAAVVRVGDLVIGDGEVTEKGVVTVEDGEEYVYPYGEAIAGSRAAIVSYYGVEDLDGNKPLEPTVNTAVEDLGSASDPKADTPSLMEYLKSGPYNEAYLSNMAALAFVAEGNAGDAGSTIQVEAKAVQLAGSGSGGVKKLPLRVLGYDAETESYSEINLEQEESAVQVGTVAMYYRIPVERTIMLGENRYLVVILGTMDFGSGTYLSLSNIKYKGYTLSNPLSEEEASSAWDHIEAVYEEDNPVKLVSLSAASARRGGEASFTLTVENTENVDPEKFVVIANDNEVTARISVKDEASGTYTVIVKAAKTTGKYIVTVKYPTDSGDEYVSNWLTVVR